MEDLNAEKIKKLKRGEAVGTAATVVCGGVTAAFIVCFSIAQTQDIFTLRMISIILMPVLLVASVAVAAYCNLKFGRQLDGLIRNYVRDVLIENAALMHPDRNQLSFGVSVFETSAEIKVNNFKETIRFDFSAFGKLSVSRKSAVSEAIAKRLNATFCRLYERGVNYNSVSYFLANGNKKSKVVYVIKDGQPEKRAYKMYLKTN